MDAEIKFIGKIKSALKKIEDCPLQETENAPQAEIVINSEYLEAMKDISAGDEIVILTWFHMSDRKILTTKPRNDQSLPDTGIFSTRSPDRPNPIGMHIAKVISVSNNNIKVSNLEALDGTPVVDIKPVLKRALS